MRKLLGLLATAALGLLIFGIVTSSTDANESIFGKGMAADQETAKQISLGILRQNAQQKQIGNVDDYIVKRVEIDELKMAHTHV